MSTSKPSPIDVEKVVDTPQAKKTRHDHELNHARQDGFMDGLEKGRREILDWLQTAYLAAEAPDRGTPEAAAILKVARDASLHFNKLVDRGRSNRKGRR